MILLIFYQQTYMKISPKSLTLVLGTVAGISLVSLLMPQMSWAQTTNVNPLQDLNPEQNQDPFSSSSEGNSFSMFDIIHRANLGGSLNIDDYNTAQNESLNNAAAEFRKKQLQRMQQQQATPINQVTTPQVAN